MKSWKFLLILFISLVIIKAALASLVLAPSMFSDEYEYAKMAQSFSNNRDFSVDGRQDMALAPLYSAALSPAYIFDNMRTTYFMMKLINALLSSLAIIPAYLIGKEIMKKNHALLSATLVGIMPSTFSYSPFLMAENLLIPLMLFATYFLYKIYTGENNKKYFFLIPFTILAIAAYLTKPLAIALIPALVLILFADYLKSSNKFIPTAILASFISLTAIALTLIGNPFFQYINYLSLPRQPYWQIALSISLWVAIYLGLAVVATCFLPVLLLAKEKTEKEKKLFALTLILLLATMGIVIKLHLNPHTLFLDTTLLGFMQGRAMGRYFGFVLPLLLIGGAAALGTKPRSRFLAGSAIASITSVSASGLLPLNNLSTSLFGAAKLAYEKLIGSVAMLNPNYFIFSAIAGIATIVFARSIFKNHDKRKTLILLAISFFLLTNAFNIISTSYNANTYWYNGPQMQLGLWINDQKLEGNFLIDENYEGKITKLRQDTLYEKDAATIAGFWIKNPLKIGDPNNLKDINYVISKQKLDLPLLKQTKDEIYLYEVPKEMRK